MVNFRIEKMGLYMRYYFCAALVSLSILVLVLPHFLLDARGIVRSLKEFERIDVSQDHDLFLRSLKAELEIFTNRNDFRNLVKEAIDKDISRSNPQEDLLKQNMIVLVLDGHDDTIRPIFSDLQHKLNSQGIDFLRVPLIGYGSSQSVFNHPSLIDEGESHCKMTERNKTVAQLVASFVLIPSLIVERLLAEYDDVRIYSFSGGGFVAYFLGILYPGISFIEIQSGFYPSDYFIRHLPSFYGDCEYQKFLESGYSYSALADFGVGISERISFYFSLRDPCCFSGLGSLFLYFRSKVSREFLVTLDIFRSQHEIDERNMNQFVNR